MTARKTSRRRQALLLQDRAPAAEFALLDRPPSGADPDDGELRAAIREKHAERRPAPSAHVRGAVAETLSALTIDVVHAEALHDLLMLARGMAANESDLDADWRGRDALRSFAVEPTEDAFQSLHVMTRLRIVERALADGGVPQEERTITRRWEALDRGFFMGVAFGKAAAALAEETTPVMGRPGIPAGLRFAVTALAAFWLEHGPRHRDSRGRLCGPRVSESRNVGSFADFAVRLLTLDGAFGEPQVRWVVRETVAARKAATSSPPQD
jgi:hypothetical protein